MSVSLWRIIFCCLICAKSGIIFPQKNSMVILSPPRTVSLPVPAPQAETNHELYHQKSSGEDVFPVAGGEIQPDKNNSAPNLHWLFSVCCHERICSADVFMFLFKRRYQEN